MPDEPIENQSDNVEDEQGDPQQDPPPASVDDADDTGGGLSQADIDAALNAANEAIAQSTQGETAEDSGDLSPADIDAAMNAAAAGSEPESAPPADTPSDTGALSQADIDAALLQSAVETADAGADSGNAVSQADIDAALAELDTATTTPDASPADDRVDSAGRPFDDIAAAMAAAIEDEAPAPPPSVATGPQPEPMEVADFSAETAANADQDISILHDVSLRVHVELGRTKMYIEDVLRLGEGSVVELQNLAGDPVDIYVNGRLIARGEVLVLSDNFCVRISEIVQGLQDVSAA